MRFIISNPLQLEFKVVFYMHVFKSEVFMSHHRIPKNWTIKRSTPFFTKDNVPAALLSHHNTAAGIFGQLCVMEGTVTYYGLRQ
ncbi:Uncharacterized protein/domain, possibly involved in tellurite resistance [Leclercia adecarboxylata]|uniref:Uncharacterized protein/domain, possibly involved in tellurite resistance n=1 Tax=Leclercia adecarboxylata TaxID=83655 RepID=A0A4U9IQY7_9ENTR|nr:Uncharacterized protein/domain, possibly involved in tellurite resistance [Leclercia adecarboxylata]